VSKSARFGFRHAWFLAALAALPASADTVRVYITNSAGDNIHVIDPATNKVVQVISGIEAPHGIDFAPDGSRVLRQQRVGQHAGCGRPQEREGH